MKNSILALILLCGCAVRFQTQPPSFEAGFLYSRITNCTAQDVPPPLLPDAEAPSIPPLLKAPPTTTAEEGKMTVQGGATHCTTLEVGAKSYADSLSAIGAAVIGILAKVALF